MSAKQLYQCNYCHGEDPVAAVENIKDWEYGVEGEYAYFRCRQCHGVQIQPFPSLQDLEKAYDIDYHGYVAGKQRGKLFSLMYSAQEALFRRMMRNYVAENSRILDIGCGAGDFLLSMQALGARHLEGIDFSKDMIDHLESKGIRGFCGTFPEFPAEPGSYDLIAMNNYLEHTLSPKEELAKTRDLLAPGAYLIGEVPGFDSWEQKLFGRFWGGNHVPRHTYQFSPGFLHSQLREAGFRDIRIMHQLNTSHWALSVQNFLQRNADDLRNNPAIHNGRSRYYVALLLLFIPISAISVLAKKSGCLKFTARAPGNGEPGG